MAIQVINHEQHNRTRNIHKINCVTFFHFHSIFTFARYAFKEFRMMYYKTYLSSEHSNPNFNTCCSISNEQQWQCHSVNGCNVLALLCYVFRVIVVCSARILIEHIGRLTSLLTLFATTRYYPKDIESLTSGHSVFELSCSLTIIFTSKQCTIVQCTPLKRIDIWTTHKTCTAWLPSEHTNWLDGWCWSCAFKRIHIVSRSEMLRFR